MFDIGRRRGESAGGRYRAECQPLLLGSEHVPERAEQLAAAKTESDAEKLAQLFIEMNDPVILNQAFIPLVLVATPRGASKELRKENIALGAFSYDYWNIANWNFADAE